MKRLLLLATVAVLLVAAGLYWWRGPFGPGAPDPLTADMFLSGDYDSFDVGPAPGSHFPGVRARYQGEQITLLDRFAGHNGTVLVSSRSLDWCPYCKREMLQLQAHKAAFDEAGIGLVAITYDPPALQQAFIDQHGITIPVLSDIDALTFKTLGILNPDYGPGDPHYGIPAPGMIVIAPNGKVAGKLFLEAYSTRVEAGAALQFARSVLATVAAM
jgi:peroxiredoxin